MRTFVLLNFGFEIEIVHAIIAKTRVERFRGFTPGLAGLVLGESPLDNFGYRPVFPAREAMREVPSPSATDGKLRFGHDLNPIVTIHPTLRAIKLAAKRPSAA